MNLSIRYLQPFVWNSVKRRYHAYELRGENNLVFIGEKINSKGVDLTFHARGIADPRPWNCTSKPLDFGYGGEKINATVGRR